MYNFMYREGVYNSIITKFHLLYRSLMTNDTSDSKHLRLLENDVCFMEKMANDTSIDL